jgi:cystathionine beta-lyase/cystathionine gamma-synthase
VDHDRADAVLRRSWLDLQDDVEELDHLIRGRYALLMRAVAELRAVGWALRPATARALTDEIRAHLARARLQLDGVERLRAATADRGDERRLDALSAERSEQADVARALMPSAAALVVAADWQSPSFAHSVRPTAGRRSGRVQEHHDDYQRDRHRDAAEFERRYLEEYVDASPGWSLGALMTSCGMSAVTTVLAWLADRIGKDPSAIVVGRSVYHETRDLIARSPLGDRTELVDEGAIPRAAARRKARLIVLDTMANARSLAICDLRGLLRTVKDQAPPVYLLVDTTSLGPASSPFAAAGPAPGVRLIALESLTKHAQIGTDRAAAGIVVAEPDTIAALEPYREHLGTNVTAEAALSIPRPCRAVLDRRLARLGRNAELLTERLERAAVRTEGPVRGATHPSLPHHPGHALAAGLPFRGSFLAVRIHPDDDRPEVRDGLVHGFLREARSRSVPLVGGASFGLDVTRVYATGATSRTTPPFVRIAAGTEHRLGVERLGDALEAAVASLGRVPGRTLDPLGSGGGR